MSVLFCIISAFHRHDQSFATINPPRIFATDEEGFPVVAFLLELFMNISPETSVSTSQ